MSDRSTLAPVSPLGTRGCLPGYVFCTPDGTVYDRDRFSREFIRKQEHFNRVHRDEPLPRLTLHGVRHTWATLALHEGINIKVISDRLNQSSTFVTRETHARHPADAERRCRASRSAKSFVGDEKARALGLCHIRRVRTRPGPASRQDRVDHSSRVSDDQGNDATSDSDGVTTVDVADDSLESRA